MLAPIEFVFGYEDLQREFRAALPLILTGDDPLELPEYIWHWSQDEEIELLNMREGGVSYRDIADKLGRTLAAVSEKSQRLKARYA